MKLRKNGRYVNIKNSENYIKGQILQKRIMERKLIVENGTREYIIWEETVGNTETKMGR